MRLHGVAGIALLILSQVLLFKRVEPFVTLFYPLVWWSYILIVDSLVFKLKGQSLILTRTGEFAKMLPLSVFIWLIFEMFNLRLGNWRYINITPQVWVRWPGYAIAFATVLPAIFQTAELVQALIFEPRPQAVDPIRLGRWPLKLIATLGLLMLLLALLLPRYFFPAVWLGFILLLDPINYRLGFSSLLADIEKGKRQAILSLLFGGFVCGLLWEFWNFWAVAKWVYSIPIFDGWKIFEMPLLGFLGFPPFALECYVMYHSLKALERRLDSKMRLAFALLLVLFALVAFHAIDSRTVVSFRDVSRISAPFSRPELSASNPSLFRL